MTKPHTPRYLMVYAQTRILAQACEDLHMLRKKFDAAGVHLSIMRSLHDAIDHAEQASTALDFTYRMLREAAEQAAKQ